MLADTTVVMTVWILAELLDSSTAAPMVIGLAAQRVWWTVA